MPPHTNTTASTTATTMAMIQPAPIPLFGGMPAPVKRRHAVRAAER